MSSPGSTSTPCWPTADLDELVARIDLQAVVDRLDLDQIIAKVDINAVLQRVDIDALVERTELGALMARSGSAVMAQAVDMRAQPGGRARLVRPPLGRPHPAPGCVGSAGRATAAAPANGG